MTTFKTLDDLADLSGKRILLRVDLNVPVKDGKVTDTTRIERVAPTIMELSRKGARVILLAHFGRPKGEAVPSMSLGPIAGIVENVLDHRVHFAADCIGEAAQKAVEAMVDGDVLLRDRVAESGAIAGDRVQGLALQARRHLRQRRLRHRPSRALLHGRHEPGFDLVAGRTMEAELVALEKGLGKPARPVVAIVGGAKVSTKIDLLQNLVNQVDALVIGGGMANTFIAARGIDVGKSLCEHDLAATAKEPSKPKHRRPDAQSSCR